jgi:hypothetical protein
MTVALDGGTPDRTPLGIYNFFIQDMNDPRWRRLIERGLVPIIHTNTCYGIEHDVVNSEEERREGDRLYKIRRKKTPVGTLRNVTLNGWHYEDWIKTPADYKIRQWMVEHTELRPCYENYERADAEAGRSGFPIVTISRTPAMSINIDWAGTERFCLDVATGVPELFDLYEAQKRLFRQELEIVAKGPGRFVKSFENLTIGMLGPRRYGELLMPVYRECFPLLTDAGKRVFVHYDGALSVIADQIAQAPFHGIESLTEPPEGDLTYDRCRAAWPDLAFWGNINVGLYSRPAEELAREVAAKRARAGKRGLVFEVSEDLPANWETSIPVVLDALERIG